MTECSRCGDCCERIPFTGSWTRLQAWLDYATSWRDWAWEHLLDGEDGGLDQPALDSIANARFMLAHWRPIAEDAAEPMPRFQCSAFDPVARLCTAHASRPPICRDYPWYGQAPNGYALGNVLGCAFWADVPLDKRPGATMRCLPVLQ